MIGRCTHGPSRREWLRTLGWQARPTVRRLARRGARAAMFIATIGYHLMAAFGGLCLAALFLKSCGVA
ncbi:hypothetical protein [Herbaspirillum huttiense]|uniref:hypothetical protein n=1 Tax=Herbaspirillum huttiense TaxID=863372 RepID=UPI003B3BDF9E